MQKLSRTIKVKLNPTKKKADWFDIIAYLLGSVAIVVTTIAILLMVFDI
jgi:hypothetical protein